MLRIAIAGLRRHALRNFLTCLAITIGVAFFTGTLVYGATARAAFADEFARAARGVDVAVNPPTGDGYDQNSHLNAGDLARIRSLPGVDQADGRMVTRLPVLDNHGRALSNNGRAGFAVSLPQVPQLAPFDLIQGRLPGVPGEAFLDSPTADRLHLAAGGHLWVLDPSGARRELAVVGVVDFGATHMFDGWSVVGLTEPDLRALTDARYFASIVVAARPGVDAGHLRDGVRQAVGADVVTGGALREALAADSAKYAQGFTDVLLASSLVALVIAGLVVFNTFTIVLTQRTTELAMLRLVGASRRQVFALVLGESAVTGLVASAAGVGLSLGLAKLIFAGRGLFGAAQLHPSLVVAPSALLAGLGLGVATSVAAAVVPAWVASRLPPLAALRTATNPPRTRRIVFRAGCAGLLGLAGVAVAGTGAGSGFAGTVQVLAGVMLVFVGCVLALGLVVVPLTTAVGWLPGRLFGVPAGLAVRNAQRNPGRIAATTTALMIGATLVSLFGVVFATSRDQSGRELAENFPVDFSVRPVGAGAGIGPLPSGLAGELRQRPEFSAVVRSHVDLLWTEDGQISMSALEPDQTAFAPEITAGSLAALGPGRIAVRRGYAAAHELALGGIIDGTTFGGEHYRATVVALFDDAPIEGELLVDWSDYRRLSGYYGDQILIRRSAGTSAADARAALDTVLAAYPLTTVTSQAERGESLRGALQRRLAQFGVLLGISVAIAIFGIGNTLALSVWERTKETATLRVLGLGRGQLRAMLIAESALMAVIGAGLGVAFGGAAGWFTARSLINVYGHGGPTVPLLPLAGFLLATALAAVLASLAPARRANRAGLSPLLRD
jgi:putative ABC transport system permease protein